jgi:hypothetical protein
MGSGCSLTPASHTAWLSAIAYLAGGGGDRPAVSVEDHSIRDLTPAVLSVKLGSGGGFVGRFVK